MKRILLAGGGTGGHIMPLLAVKEALEKKAEFKFMAIGSGLNLDFKCKNILAAKWRRYFSFKNFIDLVKIPLGLLQAFWYIFWFMPNVCFSKGGYASAPSVLICKLFLIPVIIHESDSIPGKSNKFLAKFAKKVCVSYKSASQYFKPEKIILTGNPIRRNVIRNKIINNKPIVLVLGGSQGAKFINEMITAILPKLLEKADVIHQVGKGNLSNIKFSNYKQIEFITDIGDAYAKADIIVTRAGANTLAEISANKKAAIIIPLPSAAQNHQVENAYAYARNQAASVFEEANLGPLTLLKDIISYLEQPERAKKMGEHAYEMNPIDAAEKIASVILEYV